MAGFAAISWQLEATAKLFRDSDSASTPAAKSCELARSVVAHCQAEARRIIRDLRDAEEGTNILLQALSRTLATNQMQELTPGCVHHLVCIGQEAVSTRFAMPSPRPSSSTSSMRVTLSTYPSAMTAADSMRPIGPHRVEDTSAFP
jgi:hypothetical protein